MELHLKTYFVLNSLSALSHERETLLCEENVELDKKMKLKEYLQEEKITPFLFIQK